MIDEIVIKKIVDGKEQKRVLTKIKEERIVKGGYFSAPTSPRPSKRIGAQGGTGTPSLKVCLMIKDRDD